MQTLTARSEKAASVPLDVALPAAAAKLVGDALSLISQTIVEHE